MCRNRSRWVVGLCLAGWLAAGCDGAVESNDNTNSLPDDWKGATRLETSQGMLIEEADAGTCLQCNEVSDEKLIRASRRPDGEVHMEIVACTNCAMPLGVYRRQTGDKVEILVNPDYYDVFACGSCTYRTNFSIGELTVGATVDVFFGGYMDDPVEPFGSTTVQDAVDECADRLVCGVDSPCPNEGFDMDELQGGTIACVNVQACDGPVCVWTVEACMLDCATTDCALAESYPMQTMCE